MSERVSIALLPTNGLISIHCQVMPSMFTINLWVDKYGHAHYKYLTKIIRFYIEMLLKVILWVLLVKVQH